MMSFADMFVSFVIGFTSGAWASRSLTEYYRDKDWRIDFFKDKQKMGQCANNLILELHFLKDCREPMELADINKQILRTINNAPKFWSLRLGEVPDWCWRHSANFYSLLGQMEDILMKRNFTEIEIPQFRARLRNAQIDLLVMSPELENDPRQKYKELFNTFR